MKYQGGKFLASKDIIAAIVARTPPARAPVWIEPFCGGCSVTVRAARAGYGPIEAADANASVIAMWQQAQIDVAVFPDDVSEAEYKALKAAPDSALRGFAGIGCAFGAIWFAPYARASRDRTKTLNFAAQTKRVLARDIADLPASRVTFAARDYRATPTGRGRVIYCDPPYDVAGASKYAHRIDTAEFWQWVRDRTRDGDYVYASSYAAPPDFACIMERTTPNVISSSDKTQRQTERLFVYMA